MRLPLPSLPSATLLSCLLSFLLSTAAVAATPYASQNNVAPNTQTGTTAQSTPSQNVPPGTGTGIAPRDDNRGNAGNDNRNPPPGCSRNDWLAGRCTQHPDRDPHRYRRPVVVVPAANTAPVDDAPLTDDWEGCRAAKLRQMNSTGSGDLTQAKQLEEWLWKNCRSYSEELRQLEQDRM